MTGVTMTVFVLVGMIYGEAGLMLNDKYQQDFSPRNFPSMDICRRVAAEVIRFKPPFINEVNITCIPFDSNLDRKSD